MPEDSKKKLRLATVVYWVLLSYIIAALVWWCFSLYDQNEEMYRLKKQNLLESGKAHTPAFNRQMSEIDEERWRNNAKYISEGVTFLILLLIGAVYIYRSVRRQFNAQVQQQNFMMAVTHELKTPISVSRLNLETMQRHNLGAEQKDKLVQTTLQETLRLDNLINNILISSQLDGNSYHAAKEDLNFSDLAQAVVSQFAARYNDRQLVTEIDPDIDLRGDPLLLKLLVSNLLENANKYSPRHKPVKLRLSEKGKWIFLEVKDEGPGIDPSERKNIFRKFYRIGNEQTRKTKGTGLGLFLCKKIAEDHKGQITVEDNQPQGSNFIVQFLV